MLNSLYISALGMHAQKAQLDVVSNNLANANTTGYKRERLDFSALLDRQQASFVTTSGTMQPTEQTQASQGPSLRRDLSQGELRATDSVLDLAINGAGFIEVAGNGQARAYIRGGSLQINADGYLTTSDGRLLAADIRIPTGATQLTIDGKGVVHALLGSDTQTTELGRIPLVSFSNPDLLTYLGGGLFEAGTDQAVASRGFAEEEGMGSLASRKLEMSNVKLVDEMVSLMMAQRIYELNSRVVQASDELMSLTNNLRRG
jgi:flagellar basal-body rod protein FlgG